MVAAADGEDEDATDDDVEDVDVDEDGDPRGNATPSKTLPEIKTLTSSLSTLYPNSLSPHLPFFSPLVLDVPPLDEDDEE